MTTWKKILLSITVLIFLAGAVLAIYVQSSNSSWQQYLAQLQAAGEPLTFAEIQARRSPQPTTNTIAEVVTRVADILDNVQGPNSQGVYGMSDGPDFDFFVGLDAEAIETTRYYIRPRLSILVELDDLSELAPGRFVIDYTGSALENMNAFPGQSPRTSSITRHLYIVAMLHLIDGNGKASADMIQKLHDIMLPLTEEPSSLAHLMHIIATNSAIDILENVLRVGTIDDKTLRQLDQEFADYVNSHSIRWALWGERAIFIDLSYIWNPTISMESIISFADTRAARQQGAVMLSWLIDAAIDPFSLLAANEKVVLELPKLSKTHLFTEMFLEIIIRSVVQHVQSLADMHAARIAIAAERFRLVEGRFPETLSELVPAYIQDIPVDPFDQSPMKLARNDAGIIIYSVGDDGVDDGGQVAPDKDHKRAMDRGFRLLKVSKRGLVINEASDTN